MSMEAAEAVAAMIAEAKKAREQLYADRQAQKAAFRAEYQERRKHGLVARYAAKRARLAVQD